MAGEQPVTMETVHPVAMRILTGWWGGFFSPPFLSFCETSALIQERALRMYDPCKHRVPIDQAPLLLGVCAGSRNKGWRKEERKLHTTAPSKQHWQCLWGLSGATSSSLSIPVILWFHPHSSPLHLPFRLLSLTRGHQKWPKSPPCAPMGTSTGGAISNNQGTDLSLHGRGPGLLSFPPSPGLSGAGGTRCVGVSQTQLPFQPSSG